MRWLVGGVVLGVVLLPVAFLKHRQGEYRNFRAVEDGVLYRGGQMPAASLARVVREYKIRTVVSLRDSYDDGPPPDLAEERYCAANGLGFYRISHAVWSAPDGSVPAAEKVEEFLRIAERRDELKPILVHCFAGLHRTGAQVAAYRMRFNGWSADEAIAEMREIQPRRAGFTDDMLKYLRQFK